MPATVAVKNNPSLKSLFHKLHIDSLHALVFSARRGVKPKVFYDFSAAIDMPEKTLAGILNLSARTISNYQQQQKALEPVYSEHLLKLIALYEKGERLFGNVDEFNYWLKKPFWNSKETPLQWIVTPGGVDLLMEELDKLAQGYPV